LAFKQFKFLLHPPSTVLIKLSKFEGTCWNQFWE
jgi:hypothetical protein